ncbi:MAG: fumarylacetoacetate hydrolase family protein [Rhodoferax sp.]|nr:fumarylacetoacetate hydrolase family protein [Rhodoferax sp.]
MNYAKHAEDARRAGVQVPDTQVWFNKQVSCINGPFDPVHMPRVSDKLDYEAELGVAIGRRCRHVSAKDARSVIAGYMVCNDISVRDWQKRSATMTLGKSFNTTGPTGPWLVTGSIHTLTMSPHPPVTPVTPVPPCCTCTRATRPTAGPRSSPRSTPSSWSASTPRPTR